MAEVETAPAAVEYQQKELVYCSGKLCGVDHYKDFTNCPTYSVFIAARSR